MSKPEPQLTPFLVDAKTAAKLCGCGISMWYELSATGQIPASAKLNSKSLWSYDLLKLWANNGCPSRDSVEWQELLKGNK